MKHRRGIFWMELGSDIPTQGRYLDYLHQISSRVDAHTFHASRLVFLFICVVEFVAVAMTLFDKLRVGCRRVCFHGATALPQFAIVCSQTHRSAHLGDAFLFLHQVDDGVRRVCRHLTAVGIRIAQHIPGKLYRHHLHAQTDAKGRNIVRPGVLCGYQFSLNAPLTETGTDDDACHSLQLRGYIVRSHSLAVDEMQSHFHIIIYTCQVQALPNTLIRILQVVFAHQSDVHLTGGTALLVEECVPGSHASLSPPCRGGVGGEAFL